jgi:mycothiol synthase
VTGPHWRRTLSTAEQDAVRTLLADAERIDGVAPVGEQVLRGLSGDRAEHLLIHDEGGAVVGYLNLATDGTAELAVHPRARCRGVGTALVTAACDLGPTTLRFWAHGTLPAAKALAAKGNLRPVRELIQMRRPLSDFPDVTVPQGISIRTWAGAADDAELLRVNNAAFSWHPEQGGWTGKDISDRYAEPWFDPKGLLLAVDDSTGAVCGFHWTKVHDDRLGEVYVLGVDPSAQGRGLGRTLTVSGLHHLAERLGDDATVMLYVEADNVAAITTYESLGFRRSTTDTGYAPA